MATHLVEIREGAGKARLVSLRNMPFWIGRDPSNQLVLSSAVVSRRHARIEDRDGALYVVDNDSRNGVLLNGERLQQQHPLHPGDTLVIGPFQLCLRLEAQPVASTPGGETVDFFRPQPSWDPLCELSTAIAPGAETPSVSWQRLCRLLLEGEPQELFEATLEVVEEIIPFDRCFLVLLRDEALEKLEIAAQRFGRSCRARGSSEVYVSRDILQRVMSRAEAVAVSAEQRSFDPSESFVQSGARSVLCIPLLRNGKVLGVLYLDRLVGGQPFSEEVVLRLAPISGLVALRIENQRLAEAQLEAQVQKREIEAARSVQSCFGPKRIPTPHGYEVDAFSRPCLDVGGDCLEVIDRGGGKLDFLVGDVTGKGLAAALYMVGVVSTVRAHLIDGFELEDVLTRLESHVCARFQPDHFLTAVLGELEVGRNHLSFCNAGHPYPILFEANGEIVELSEHGPAFNIAPCDEYHRFERQLAPGEMVLICTDGVLEWADERGELFGKERLIACVREHQGEGLAAIRTAILSALERFAPGPPGDDLTLLLLRRKGGELRR